jgi:prepilin-type N-terminal cleavage/methylation domain-containing protein
MHATHTYNADRGRRSGFSMVELLVSMAIMGIVIGLSLLTFQSALGTREKSKKMVAAQERGRIILLRMTDRLRGASPGSDSFLSNTLRASQPIGYRFVGRSITRTGIESLGEDPEENFAINLMPVVYLNIDNDLDGRIDEDPWDGLDNDGDYFVDEDPATIPFDIVNFTAPIPNGGDIDMVEIGYGIHHEYPNSFRERLRIFKLEGTTDIGDFGIFQDSPGIDASFLSNESAFASASTALEEIAEDIVGMDISYTFRDGNQNMITVQNWDTANPAIVNAELGRQPSTDSDILSRLPMLINIAVWIANEDRQAPPVMMRAMVAPANR